jgi:hypothetical protein
VKPPFSLAVRNNVARAAARRVTRNSSASLSCSFIPRSFAFRVFDMTVLSRAHRLPDPASYGEPRSAVLHLNRSIASTRCVRVKALGVRALGPARVSSSTTAALNVQRRGKARCSEATEGR